MPRGRLLSAADIANCTHRVALERGATTDDGRPGAPPEIERRIRAGSTHREAILAELVARHPDVAVAADFAHTEALAREGVELILRPRLADTGPGRRLMTADALVRTSVEGDAPTYAPVIIKNNEVTEPSVTRRLLAGTLDAPAPARAAWIDGVGARRNNVMVRNGLALGHATRVLEAFGHGDPQHYGGIIDRQGQLWWFALADPAWGRWRLQHYDEAHAVRLEILERHEQWVRGEGPFPTTPFWHRACPECPFADRCHGELEAHDDVSLVRFTTKEQQALLRDHDVPTRRALATLDPVRAAAAREHLFDPATETERELHLGRAIDRFDELIYRARAAVFGRPLRKVPPTAVGCPTADVEVDVDMESYLDVTYLWGALVTVRRPVSGVESGFRPFVRWSASAADEHDVFMEFWRWFSELRDRVIAGGATFTAYCFWARAEDGAMDRALRGGGDAPVREALDAFRRREPREWIDLHEVVRGQLQTEGPLGLKGLAQAAGFSWRDEHPSGEASMSWFEQAAGPTGDQAARDRLLTYNEDDCRATRALRKWLNGAARDLPSRDDRP